MPRQLKLSWDGSGLGARVPRHGTLACYTNKACRCQECCEAQREYHRAYRKLCASRTIPPGIKHGRGVYSRYKCRCEVCYEAAFEYRQLLKARARAQDEEKAS